MLILSHYETLPLTASSDTCRLDGKRGEISPEGRKSAVKTTEVQTILQENSLALVHTMNRM